MPYESHRASKWSLNSLPLSYIMCRQRGYLLNQVLLTKVLIMLEDLSKYASLVFIMYLCLNLTLRGRGKFHYRQFYNFEPARSGIRHMKSISVPSLPRSMYGLIKSTHTASQGVIVTIIVGSFPYFCERLLFTWHDLQFLTYDCTVERMCFQYIAALSVSSRRLFPGCCR